MSFKEILGTQLFTIGKFTLTVQKIFIILIGIVITKIILTFIKVLLYRTLRKNNDPRQKSLYQLIQYIVWIIAISILLHAIGINITILIASSAALFVGIGFGLKQFFEDIISGIIILIDGTVKVRDVIEVDGIVGKIKDINLRFSRIVTRDDIVLIVPNSKFINGNVINWSHNTETTRFSIKIGVSYRSNPEKVRDVILYAVRNHPLILKVPPHAPFVRLANFGDSALEFELLFWSNEIFIVENIKSDLRFAIFEELSKNNIEIAYPQRDVHIISHEPASKFLNY